MRTINRRIGKLTDRLLPGDASPLRTWVLTNLGCELALDLDRCTEILDECGFLPAGRFGVVNLCGIPEGLSADELERFLREKSAAGGGFRRVSSEFGRIVETRELERAAEERP